MLSDDVKVREQRESGESVLFLSNDHFQTYKCITILVYPLASLTHNLDDDDSIALLFDSSSSSSSSRKLITLSVMKSKESIRS